MDHKGVSMELIDDYLEWLLTIQVKPPEIEDPSSFAALPTDVDIDSWLEIVWPIIEEVES